MLKLRNTCKKYSKKHDLSAWICILAIHIEVIHTNLASLTFICCVKYKITHIEYHYIKYVTKITCIFVNAC